MKKYTNREQYLESINNIGVKILFQMRINLKDNSFIKLQRFSLKRKETLLFNLYKVLENVNPNGA